MKRTDTNPATPPAQCVRGQRRYAFSLQALANALTASRIAASLLLLFAPVFSAVFYVLYAYCGVSDMLDGSVARRAGTASKAGAMLDSVADLVFFSACAVKLFPIWALAPWIWAWIGAIALVKGSSAAFAVVHHMRPVFLHTTANRVTGFLLFLLPVAVRWVPLAVAAPILCAVASFAAVQEGYFIRQKDSSDT